MLAGHLPHVREIAGRLRELVREAVPEVEERVNPGWHSLAYNHPEAGYFAGIFPRDQHVDLLFEHGVRLADPDGVLEGAGSQTRHIRVWDVTEIPEQSARSLLRDALEV